MSQQNTIKIALLGERNSGKSTFMNCITSKFTAKSGIKVEESTNVPHIYHISDSPNNNYEVKLSEQNDMFNIVEEYITLNDPFISNEILNGKSYEIIDTPGCNDSSTSEKLYKWLNQKSKEIDFFLVIVDVKD